VLEEKVKYGLLIHEMQQTYKEYGLEKVVDLGEFWFNLTKLPIPLGCIVIRKTLPSSVKQKIKEHIKESILFALSNKNKAFEYSLKFARFSDRNNTLTFIDKYVKEFSLHIDEKHAQAITTLAEFAYKNGLINKEVKITII
jgi:1,4-dihydroxy-6-naphthoate synthase